MDSFEVTQALYRVRRYAIGSVLANDYARDEDPHADAGAEYADESLALAARELVAAVEALPDRDRPIGWDTDNPLALRTEVSNYELAVLHMLALAPSEYRTCIIASRAAGTDADYAKNNGRAEMIRTFATGLAERAGVPVPDWEQIKQGVPADGGYRGEAATRA